MTVTVKSKSALAVPTEVQRRAGIKAGDQIEFIVSGGIITIVPKLPSAEDEYTPEQRRAIDAQLKQGVEDIKSGRTSGPFNTADEMIAHMKGQLKKRAATKASKPSR